MRTLFVNPAARSRKRRKTRKNPRRSHRRPARRVRRRNAGITPFVAASNPALMSNPRRRRSIRRHNPIASPKAMFEETLLGLGGAGIAVGANLGLGRIQNTWARNGSRVAAALAASAFIPGRLGAATTGAMLFPSVMELVAHFAPSLVGAAPVGADLDQLSADLEAILNDA